MKPLTERQLEIARLVAAGARSNLQVAIALGLSEQTVKNQLHTVFKSLGVANRTALVLWVLANDREAA
jgi:DNA-binding NarL/FixJ family response regulator